jgi:hypothetical protein
MSAPTTFDAFFFAKLRCTHYLDQRHLNMPIHMTASGVYSLPSVSNVTPDDMRALLDGVTTVLSMNVKGTNARVYVIEVDGMKPFLSAASVMRIDSEALAVLGGNGSRVVGRRLCGMLRAVEDEFDLMFDESFHDWMGTVGTFGAWMEAMGKGVAMPKGIARTVFGDDSDDDDEVCAICCQPGRDFMLKCGHAFHQGCLAKWCRRNPSCPMCRKGVCMETCCV